MHTPDVGPFIGADVGGTFSDLVLVTASGELTCLKVPTVRTDPAQSTIQGLRELIEDGAISTQDLRSARHTHSSTVATNALIERDGPPVALITTRGFRDVLLLQRLALPHPMKFDSRRPTPLVQRRHIFEITERLNSRGEVLVPLQESEVVGLVKSLRAAGIEHAVVSLLHSYQNGVHEKRLGNLLQKLMPELHIDISHEVWPQAREYERSTLCTMNAFVRSKINAYAENLIEEVGKLGFETQPLISRSNGGMELLETLRDRPVSALLSGPAAGVTGAAAVAAQVGWSGVELMTLDIGGTSADIGIIKEQKAVLSQEEHIADYPLLQPSVAVSAIGAGGGSELWRHVDGSLKIGPASVGSHPGPLCYGNPEAKVPAISDAFLVAGILSGGQRLAGRLDLDEAAARRGIAQLGGGSAEDIAASAIKIATAMMSAEAMNVFSKRRVDTTNLRMIAYGGAGPMFAALLAEEINVREVLIPHIPGALSAFGAALADLEGDLIKPIYTRLDHLDAASLSSHYRDITLQSDAWLQHQTQSLATLAVTITYSAEMRYEGQGYDVSVPLEGQWLADGDTFEIRRAFDRAHREAYGHASETLPVRLNEIRTHIVGLVDKPLSARRMPQRAGFATGERTIRLYEGPMTAVVRHRDDLEIGETIQGPAVIEQMDTTTFVPPRWTLVVTESRNLILRNEGAHQ